MPGTTMMIHISVKQLQEIVILLDNFVEMKITFTWYFLWNQLLQLYCLKFIFKFDKDRVIKVKV